MAKIDQYRVIQGCRAGFLADLLGESGSELLATDAMSVSVGDVEMSHPVECSVGRPVPAAVGVWVVEIEITGAAPHSGWFPRCRLELQIRSVDGEAPSTELALVGEYRLPLRSVGWLADRFILHALAGSSIRRYFDQVVARIEHRVGEVDALIGVPV